MNRVIRLKDTIKLLFENKEFLRLEVYAFLIFILSSILVGYYSYQNQIAQLKELVALKQETHLQLFNTLVESDAEGLSRAMDGYSQLDPLLESFENGDRELLTSIIAPMFEKLRVNHNITHAYFIDVDGVVFLRAHKPEQHGDKLNRTTYMLSSERHALACGIEMGRNFYSLRCVQPIYHQDRFIGYLEMAQEIDHIFKQIKETVNEDFSMLLTEEYLIKINASMELKNYGNFFLLESTNVELLESILVEVNVDDIPLNQSVHKLIKYNEDMYALYISPFSDVTGEFPGITMSLRNISKQYDEIWGDLFANAALILSIILGSAVLIILSTKRSINTLESRVIARTKRIEHMAYHDALTGLPNRAMFNLFLEKNIAHSKRYHKKLSVIFIDLDNFKIINDTLGHEAGDTLLKKASARIKACLRESDFVARLGGDEFVVILPQVSAEEENTDHAKQTISVKILKALEKPFELYNENYSISASIGISSYPKDGEDESTLIKHADIAMYEAKGSGKNNIYIFSASMNKKYSDKLGLSQAI